MCEISQMGETHEKTKESSEYLKFLTQQAVALQRTMNEIYKNGSHASIMPLKVASSSLIAASDSNLSVSSDANWLFFSSFLLLQFTAPSMASVLEQLNIINGIIFIPLR